MRHYAINTKDWTWTWVPAHKLDEFLEKEEFIINEVPEEVTFPEMMAAMPKVIETFQRFLN